MNELQQSAATTVTIGPVILAADNVTGTPSDVSGTWTLQLKKFGGAFATITPTSVTFRGSGFYDIGLSTSHTDTLRDAMFLITSPTTVDYSEKFFIVTYDPSTVQTASAAIAAAVWDALRASHTVAGSFGEGAASVQGNVTGSVGSVAGGVGGSVAGSVGSVTGNVGGNVVGSTGSVAGDVAGNVTGNITGSVGSVVGLTPSRLDVNVSSRAQPSDIPTAATIAAAVWATVIESTHDAAGFLRMLLAVSAGPATGVGTASTIWKSINGAVNRVQGTVVAGVRTITGLIST